jgi:hypothetical protein
LAAARFHTGSTRNAPRLVLGLDHADTGTATIGGRRYADLDADPWQGFAVLCGWTALLLAAALYLLRRRDA